MRPIIVTIPGINWDVPGYGLMLMLGLFVSIWWAARRALKSHGSPDVILNCGFIAIIAGVVGARAMYVIHYWPQFAAHSSALSVAIAVIDVRKGGLEFYGGFILTIICVLAWLRFWEKVSLRWYLDIIAPSAALGLALGRVGCLLNGCCFGSTCNLPWAVRFPFGSSACLHHWQDRLPGAGIRAELLCADSETGYTLPLTREFMYLPAGRLQALADEYSAIVKCQSALATTTDPAEKQRLRSRLEELQRQGGGALAQYEPVLRNMEKFGLSAPQIRALAADYHSLPVHPTEPYSTITALLIALLLNALYWRRTRDGQVICTLLLIEPISRWLLEVIRADNPVDTVGMFTISQFLALCMTLLGLIGLLVLQRMPPRSPRARIWEPPDQPPPAARSSQKGGRKKGAAATD